MQDLTECYTVNYIQDSCKKIFKLKDERRC